MNVRRVARILGLLAAILAAAQLLPIAWSWLAGETHAVRAFLESSAATALLGGALYALGTSEGELYRREGVGIVVGAWALASITGALPYVASGAIPGLADALFESASGFTTTGASVLTDIEGAGRGILFWRGFTQWLGGIGIIVLFVALLSELGPGARFLFKLEVPGPKAEILHARVQHTAAALFRVYLVMSALEVVALLACGLDLYDSLTHTFATVSTGGFSPYAASMGRFGAPAQAVVVLFMAAAGANFSIYWAIAHTRSAAALRDAELWFYGALLAGATALVALDGALREAPIPVLDAAFAVASILTTTGFATADFDRWPDFSRALLVALMFVGGCAGSTAGGAKLIRVLVGWRATMREVRLIYSPRAVMAVVVGGKPVPNESVGGVASFLILWMFAWGAGALLLSVGDADLVTAATASIATLGNVGPGLAAVGPSGHFAAFADWQKLLMVFLMWLGRLEFFALLALFQPAFWRR
ncbi:MAG: TrkH family potassium uptake protein [Myxococcota bacterium]|nr:TrkH family potassium uptake protein [Myxococcales bacterium]